jgi:hypothetical protein
VLELPTELLCLLCLLQRDYYYNKDGIIASSGDGLNSTKSKKCESACRACLVWCRCGAS